MRTYEEICDLLVNAAEDVGLEVASVEHYIETITLDKEFIFVCVPPGERTSHKVRAEISLAWDSTLTAASVWGSTRRSHGHGLPEELHAEAFPLGALTGSSEEEPYFELYIKYLFEVPNAERVPELADRARSILQGVIDHDNVPELKFEVSVLPDRKVMVDDAFAFYWWQINLIEEDLDFSGIMAEVKKVLAALLISELGS